MAGFSLEERYSSFMELDPDRCYRALRTRDPRFDGRFFTAVRSTGIYCRPICPARTPKRENCIFVACAAAAAERGFRPCLRCRPEASPETPAWHGTSTTVSRALRLIADGALDGGDVGTFAARLGVGERQLRRLFAHHLGASPGAVAQTRRVLFAKKLIDETDLPMTEVALASGFSSIRRFNDAIRNVYAMPPRELRSRSAIRTRTDGTCDLTLRLAYRPPFDWSALTQFLAFRAIPGVEAVTNESYRRTFAFDEGQGSLEVSPDPKRALLLARIRFDGAVPLQRIAERVRRIFDLGADPAVIMADLGRSETLRDAVAAAPGIRVPGTWDAFELSVRAVLGQQVSVRGATTLCGRLVERFGTPARFGCGGTGAWALFPSAAILAEADVASIGLPRSRAAAISALARAAVDGVLDFGACGDLDEIVARLVNLPGIGDWTAHYIAIRAANEPDAFPAGDLGLRRAVGEEGRPATGAALRSLAESWRPWRAYAAMLLWTQASRIRRIAVR